MTKSTRWMLVLPLLAAVGAQGQPANDECATATVITSLPFSDSLDVSAATSSASDPFVPCASEFDRRDASVWYAYTAVAPIVLDIDTRTSTYHSVVAVWGGGCGTFERLACSPYNLLTSTWDRHGRAFVSVDAGETVHIEIAEEFGPAATLNLTVRTAPSGHPAPIGPEFVVNTTEYGDQGLYTYWNTIDACRSANGDFVIVWESPSVFSSESDVFGRRFAADGTPQGAEFQVNTYTTNRQDRPNVACGASGDFVVVWRDQEDPSAGVKARRFDGTGTPVTGEVSVAATGGAPVTATDSAGSFIVAWPVTPYVWARRFDATGTPTSSATAISTTDGDDLDVGIAADGSAVVTWEKFSAVTARRLDSAGAPVASEIVVTSPPGSYAYEPSVSVDASGAFVVVWEDRYPVGGDEVRARRFSASTTPGPVLVVNDFDNANVIDTDVALGDDGTFVVTWSDYYYTNDVLARRLRPDGSKIGDVEMTIPVVGYHSQGAAHVTDAVSGEFVVAWVGEDDELDYGSYGYFAGGAGVRAQRFTFAPADTVGVTGRKLIVVDKMTAAGTAKAVFVSKDENVTKGVGTDVDGIDVEFTVAYADGSTAGAFVLAAGASDGTSGWKVNKDTVAKYVNNAAPAGPTQAKVGVVKPGKLLKLVGKGLGDTPIDVFAAGAPTTQAVGQVVTSYCVKNGGEETCHCTAFPECSYKLIAADTGAKLVCRNGVPDDDCTAVAAP